MGLFFQLLLLTLLYYIGLLLFQNRKAQQLEILQKEVIGKTKPIELSIPPKEKIFGATSNSLKDMQVLYKDIPVDKTQANDKQPNNLQLKNMTTQSETIPSVDIPNPTSEPLKARELLFKGTLSDTSSIEYTATGESAIQQTVQKIIEGTSLADANLAETVLELTTVQKDFELRKSSDQQKAIATLNKTDFIPKEEPDQEMNLLYFQDIPQLMDYHRGKKK